MNSACRIEMLGGLRVHIGDRVISRFQTQKTGALLAYLAMNPGRLYPRDQLASILWPEGDSTAIRNRLNQAVSSLRRQLHPPGSDPNSVLVADHMNLSANERTVSTDVRDFQDLIKKAAKCDDDAVVVQKLRAAVDLYGGEFLCGLNEDWALMERVSQADAYYDALSRLIRLNVTMGHLAEAIEIANRRLAQDPTEERSHRALMRLYVMAGRPQSALAQYAELERTLAHEGDKPSERARKLRMEALAAAGEDTEPEQPLPSVHLDHRTPTDLPSADLPKSGLPRYLTLFFGRNQESQLLSEHLSQGSRLVTITGLGGTGKTRLAVEVARHSAQVKLINATSAMTGEELCEELGTSGLVVLDEADALEPIVLECLSAWMRAHEGIAVIATARVALGLDGEHVVPLAPLPLPSGVTFTELTANPAIQLFVDRAQSARQDFQLTERTAESIAELCRRLEGWPLALELAAGWARSMTPSQMAEQVAQHYDRLASRRKDIHPRHRSLRAAIDGSFLSLSPGSRDILGRLVVFSGGWDHASASAICPGADLHACLAELNESNLVISDAASGSMRFRMLDPVRSYAEDATANDTVAEAKLLHAEHFLHLANRLIAQSQAGFAALQQDRLNFLQALSYWHAQGAPPEATQLATSLAVYWELAERMSEGREWMSRVQPLAEQTDASMHGQFLTRFARLEWLAGNFVSAEQMIQEAMKRFRQADDLERLLEVTHLTAQEAHRQSDFSRSEALLKENISLAQKLGERSLEAQSWLALGNSLVELRRLDEAQAAYEACLHAGQQLGHAYLAAAATGNLGNLFLIQGSFEAAEAWLANAERLIDEAGMVGVGIDVRVMRARLDRMRGNHLAAIDHLKSALALGIEGPYLLSVALAEGAYSLARLGQDNNAANMLGCVEELWAGSRAKVFGIEAEIFEEEGRLLQEKLGEKVFLEQIQVGKRMERSAAIGLLSAC